MKLLLTSGGVTNTSIRDALVDLLGKAIDESSALCIPTAEYGHPWCTPASAWRRRIRMPECAGMSLELRVAGWSDPAKGTLLRLSAN